MWKDNKDIEKRGDEIKRYVNGEIKEENIRWNDVREIKNEP